MRTAARSAVLLLSLLLTACGQVEPVLLTVSMPDCTLRGPMAMQPGEASLSLSLNGLGTAQAALVEPVDGHSHDELAAYLEENGAWEDRPGWLRPVIDLELSDTDGINGIADHADLGVGEYVVVCVDLETGSARVAGVLEVAESADGFENGRGGEGGRRP